MVGLTHSEVRWGEVHTLDIAPLRGESPLQKRSGMICVLKGFHSFTCTPTRSSAIGMSHTCLCLPSKFIVVLVLIYRPRRDGRLSRPWCEVAQAEIWTRNLLIANPALYHTATIAPEHCLIDNLCADEHWGAKRSSMVDILSTLSE